MILQISAGNKLLYVGYVMTEKRARAIIDHYARIYGLSNLTINKSTKEKARKRSGH